MKRFAAAAVAAIALGAPATAHADWTSDAWNFEHRAEAYWGNGAQPTCGTVHLAWAVQADMGVSPVPGNLVAGSADTTACRVTLSVDRWRANDAPFHCRIVFHEVGHLYGHGHAEGGIMASTVTSDVRFAPCAAEDDLAERQAQYRAVTRWRLLVARVKARILRERVAR